MPSNQSLGARGTRRLDTAIREISVATGTVILTRGEETSIVVSKGQDKAFDPPQAGYVAFAPTGARFHLTYETDPPKTEQARKGVSGPAGKPKAKRPSRSSRRKSAAKAKPKAKSSKSSKGKG